MSLLEDYKKLDKKEKRLMKIIIKLSIAFLVSFVALFLILAGWLAKIDPWYAGLFFGGWVTSYFFGEIIEYIYKV